VSYEDVVSDAVKLIEGVGAGIDAGGDDLDYVIGPVERLRVTMARE
jgi:hypothetical protein